jgi:hypothetical protein
MKTLLPTAFFLLTLGAAQAQTTPGIAKTQRTERARIRQGVQSGELTRRETARVANQQADIRQDKRAAKADGVVTADERQDIRQDQRKASRTIYRQKHDAQTRTN